MKKFKNKKGITLTSLVITIIILIVLASVGTYSGIQIVNSSKLTAFTTELKIMQTKVNELYDKNSREEINISEIGEPLSTVQTQVDKVFTENESGIILTESSNYRYYDQETIKNDLGIEGVEREYFVDVQKRSVVSYEGLKYDGKTYYTLEQLPDSLYNVDYQESQEQPDFDVDYELLENGKCKISVNNINYNGNINKWKVKYKKENEEDWKQSNNYSFMIDELGNYRVKIANNNVESNEKQIMARNLPSEYKQVEYIESTGTQYINTRVIPDNTTGLYIKHSICNNNNNDNIIIGTRANNNNSRFWIDIDWGLSTLGWGFNEYSQEGRRFSLTSKEGQTIETTLNYKNERKGKVNNNEVDNFDDRGTLVNQSYPITIFCGNNQGNYGYFTKSKVYNVVISEGNNIIRNFIPCYSTTTVTDVDGKQRSIGTIGLYDIVEGEFYTNQGTGEFFIPSSMKMNLPAEYQKVEYIENTGTQYINTRVIPDNTTGLYIKHSICNNNNNDNIIIGTRANDDNSRFWIDIDWGRTDTLGWGFNEYSQEGRRFSLTSKEGQTIETTLNYKNERKGKVNNNEVDNFDDRGTLVNHSYPITIFCGNNQGNHIYFTKSKVYNVVISKGNNIIRNFIPCYTTIAVTDIDGINRQKDTIGLYDIVNNQFYTNQGTGDFEKGADVSDEEDVSDEDGMVIIINNM